MASEVKEGKEVVVNNDVTVLLMPKSHKKQALITQSKYRGKYVALHVPAKKVIASSSDASRVMKKAHQKGIKWPTLLFVPRKGVACGF